MEPESVRVDLEFLVNNPDKTSMSTYHDASKCWQLIEAALEEIRKLRKQLASANGKRRSEDNATGRPS